MLHSVATMCYLAWVRLVAIPWLDHWLAWDVLHSAARAATISCLVAIAWLDHWLAWDVLHRLGAICLAGSLAGLGCAA